MSSANIDAVLLILLSMSLMRIKNKMGPRTVPWGTPLMTEDFIDLTPFAIMICSLLFRNENNQCPNNPSIRRSFSLWHSIPWSTLSKALEKSRYITSAFPPSSRIFKILS